MLKIGCFSGRIQNVPKSVGGTLGPDGKMRTGEATTNSQSRRRESEATSPSSRSMCGASHDLLLMYFSRTPASSFYPGKLRESVATQRRAARLPCVEFRECWPTTVLRP